PHLDLHLVDAARRASSVACLPFDDRDERPRPIVRPKVIDQRSRDDRGRVPCHRGGAAVSRARP
ncbi:MAG TPA: hypothetical protein VM513_06845, partial [Kofleriaceae bacterium]|nr:hypothetical protein [Kofleriaceae bacterium]